MRTRSPISLCWLLLCLALVAGQRACGGVCGAAPNATSATHAPDAHVPERYVVDHYLYDPTLKRSWAVVVDCRNPERPASLRPASRALSGNPSGPGWGRVADLAQNSGQVPWVIAGSPVEIWKGGESRIHLYGAAVDSGPLASMVTVRIAGQAALLHGIVRGAGSVELVAEARGWREQ